LIQTGLNNLNFQGLPLPLHRKRAFRRAYPKHDQVVLPHTRLPQDCVLRRNIEAQCGVSRSAFAVRQFHNILKRSFFVVMGSRQTPRIASPRMLLDNFPPMTGAASPNRVGVVDGGKDQYGRAARGGVGGDGELPIG